MDKQVSSDPGHDPQPLTYSMKDCLVGKSEVWHESMSEADVANKVWKLWTHLMQGKEKEKKTVRAYATHLPCLWLVSCEFYGRRHWPTTTEVRAMWIASLSPQNSPTLFLLRPFFSSTHSSPLFLVFCFNNIWFPCICIHSGSEVEEHGTTMFKPWEKGQEAQFSIYLHSTKMSNCFVEITPAGCSCVLLLEF